MSPPVDRIGALVATATASWGPTVVRSERAGFATPLRAAQAADRAGVVGDVPPPEARAAVHAAQRAIEHLHATGRHLHFSANDGLLRIDVRDVDGHVLQEIPPHDALDLLDDPAKGPPWR